MYVQALAAEALVMIWFMFYETPDNFPLKTRMDYSRMTIRHNASKHFMYFRQLSRNYQRPNLLELFSKLIQLTRTTPTSVADRPKTWKHTNLAIMPIIGTPTLPGGTLSIQQGQRFSHYPKDRLPSAISMETSLKRFQMQVMV